MGTVYVVSPNQSGGSGGAPSGSAGGDLAGTYPNPTIGANKVVTAKILDANVTLAKLAPDAVGAFDAAGAAAAVAATLGSAATHSATDFDAAGAAAAVTATSIGAVPTSRTLQGTSPIAIAGDYAAHDLSGNRVITFAIASQAQGDIIYNNGSAWVRLGAGTAGSLLKTGGAGANPSWNSFANVMAFGSDAQGDLAVRGASAYGRLAIGARGTFLNANDGLTHTYVALSLMPRIDVATTIALPAYTANNSAGTLAANANGAFPTTDGVAASTGNIYLILQNSVTDNIHVGVYKLTTLGDGSNPWVLTRHDRLWVGASASGTRALIRNGTTQTGYEYQCQTTPGSDVVGTNTITFSLIGSPISSTAAANLSAAASAGVSTKTSAQDHVHQFPASGMFGTGADGSVTIASGTTTLARAMHYSSLTVAAGATLDTGGFHVFCTGTIQNDGTIGRKGNDASGATSGAVRSAQVLFQGTAGGAGGTTGVGSNGVTVSQSMGGAGGAGGTGSGGAGGTSTANAVPANQGPTDAGMGLLGFLGNQQSRFLDGQNGGAGGGGGGGSAGGSGGGGGGGGAVVCIWARALSGAGVYTAAGGIGGNAAGGGNGGGGGGGGGGRLILAYAGTTGAWTATVAGGTGGTGVGTGTNGSTGSAGTVLQIQLA